MELRHEAVDYDSPDLICMRNEEEQEEARMTAMLILRRVEHDFAARWPRKWMTCMAAKKTTSKRILARRLMINRTTVYRHLQDFNDYLDQQAERLRKKSA